MVMCPKMAATVYRMVCPWDAPAAPLRTRIGDLDQGGSALSHAYVVLLQRTTYTEAEETQLDPGLDTRL